MILLTFNDLFVSIQLHLIFNTGVYIYALIIVLHVLLNFIIQLNIYFTVYMICISYGKITDIKLPSS